MRCVSICSFLLSPKTISHNKYLQSLRETFSFDDAIEDARFEVVLVPSEGTNFDFCCQTTKARKLFEIKLTEPDFGKAKTDVSHISKFQTIYSAALNGKFDPSYCSCDVFLKHYQLMRNVWNLDVGTCDTLVCIVPKANNCLTEEIGFLKNCLSEKYQNRVSVFYLEDLTARLEKTIPDDAIRMREHFRLFREKYFPLDPIATT
jgi:hypothetical protein